jgi:hypothetical protein
MIVNLKTVSILLLLGCAGTDCGYPNVRFFGTFQTSPDVRLESGIRTRADVRRLP